MTEFSRALFDLTRKNSRICTGSQLETDMITGPNHYNRLQQTETEIMGTRQRRPPLFPFPSVVDGCNDLGPVSSLSQVDEGEPDPY